MPLYDFKCSKCGHITTFLEKADSNNEHPCEKCKDLGTARIYSSFQVKDKDEKNTCTTGTCPFG